MPRDAENLPVPVDGLLKVRKTEVAYVDGGNEVVLDDWHDERLGHRELGHEWTGRTIFEVRKTISSRSSSQTSGSFATPASASTSAEGNEKKGSTEEDELFPDMDQMRKEAAAEDDAAEPVCEECEETPNDEECEAIADAPLEEPKDEVGIARMKTEAQSLQHQLTHKPNNPFCDACKRGKMTDVRRFKNNSKRGYKEWGQLVTCDHVISETHAMHGLFGGGEKTPWL